MFHPFVFLRWLRNFGDLVCGKASQTNCVLGKVRFFWTRCACLFVLWGRVAGKYMNMRVDCLSEGEPYKILRVSWYLSFPPNMEPDFDCSWKTMFLCSPVRDGAMLVFWSPRIDEFHRQLSSSIHSRCRARLHGASHAAPLLGRGAGGQRAQLHSVAMR